MLYCHRNAENHGIFSVFPCLSGNTSLFLGHEDTKSRRFTPVCRSTWCAGTKFSELILFYFVRLRVLESSW